MWASCVRPVCGLRAFARGPRVALSAGRLLFEDKQAAPALQLSISTRTPLVGDLVNRRFNTPRCAADRRAVARLLSSCRRASLAGVAGGRRWRASPAEPHKNTGKSNYAD